MCAAWPAVVVTRASHLGTSCCFAYSPLMMMMMMMMLLMSQWSCEVLALLAGLCLVLLAWLGCGDPGIARRLVEKPPGVDNPMMGTGRGRKMGGKWMWNDQASTWRAPVFLARLLLCRLGN